MQEKILAGFRMPGTTKERQVKPRDTGRQNTCFEIVLLVSFLPLGMTVVLCLPEAN